jgi:phytoene desaturase
MNNKKALIVGAGIAGIAASIRLSKQGWQVEVIEKNDYPGGKLSHFTMGDYQFDAGPSLFTQPSNVEDLFELCGEKIENYFQYVPVDIACKYFYPSGKVVNAYTNKDKFAQELETKLGEKSDNVKAYLQDAENCYKNIGELFVDYSLHNRQLFPFKRIATALKHTKLSYLFCSLNTYNKGRFQKAETVQMFNRYATYNGSNPYTAPGMLSLIPHLEQNEGTFYPMGGMISITNALVKLAEKMGVTFKYGEEVKSIEIADNLANITTDKQTYQSNIVVSNMDVYYTYKFLLKEEAKAKQILKQERSSSALIFYWGIKKEFAELHLHNIFFTNDYASEFNAIFEKKVLYHDPTIYINITSKMESTQSKPGTENWFVMINVPHHSNQDWAEEATKAKQHILNKLKTMLGCNIEDYIAVESILHPQLIESRTMSHTGSLYGSSSNSKMAAFLRHPNFTSTNKHLYFVGGSVHPGGGIPLCLKSAKIASEIIELESKVLGE